MTDQQLLEKIAKGQEELKQEVSQIQKAVREENETETKKIRGDALLAQMHSDSVIEEIKDSVKDLTISNARLEKEQQAQGKTLKYIKTKLNRTAKTVDIIGLRYDERIVENSRRTDRIEDHLGLPR